MSIKNKRLEKEKFRNRTEQDFLSILSRLYISN
jgi:hypothetical protein